MDVSMYFEKIKLILERAFEGKIVIHEYYAEKLLKLLDDSDDDSPGKSVLNSNDFYNLLVRSVENLNKANLSLKVFLVQAATTFFKCQRRVNKMDKPQYEILLSVLDNLKCNPPPQLHFACIQFASTLIELPDWYGVYMIVEHKVFETLLYPNVHNKPKQISMAVYELMAKIIWRLEDFNREAELLTVMKHVMEPILSSEYLNTPVLDAESDTVLSDKLLPYLNTLSALLTEADSREPINIVNRLLKEHFMIDRTLYEIFSATRNLCLLKLLNAILFKYYLQLYRYLLYSQKIDEFCEKMTIFHHNYTVFAVNKRDVFTIIDFVVQSNIIWSQYKERLKTKVKFPLIYKMNNKEIDYSLQIVATLIIPIMKYSNLQHFSKYQKMEQTEMSKEFISKLSKNVTDYIYTTCNLFEELIKEHGVIFAKKITSHALKELLRLKGYLSESQAGPIFQSVYYLLDVYFDYNGAGELLVYENYKDSDDLSLLSHMLNAIKMLLREHNIPWTKNVEIVNIQSGLLNLLKQNYLTTKLVVQVLDLVNICINKFLSPNMSLLVENKHTQDSTLNEIGEVMKLYTQHEDWELRDTALTLLNSCMEICFIKYIPLQKIIKENNLAIIAAKAGLVDPEYYSQCTALRCLSTATKISSIWEEVLVDNANIYLQLVYILRNHSEGMVRKEAANVLTGVYVNQKLTTSFQNSLYEVMMSAALDDLHWEVQLAALNFWKCAIQNQQAYRGMIDGKFPPVTFSKEKRKIIKLNNAEIQIQLDAIMNHLSNIGCLTVLFECIKETYSVEVMSQAYCIAKDILTMLDQYNYDKVVGGMNVQPIDAEPNFIKQEDSMIIDFAYQTSEDRNKIIDSILSLNHSELIIDLNENYSKIKSADMDMDFTYSPQRKFVDANMFLQNFRSNDYTLIIEKIKYSNDNCFSTLDGLLDEILGL